MSRFRELLLDEKQRTVALLYLAGRVTAATLLAAVENAPELIALRLPPSGSLPGEKEVG